MLFTLSINLNNEAFDPTNLSADGGEVARTLRDIADHVEWKRVLVGDGRRLRDASGNSIGEWIVTSRDVTGAASAPVDDAAPAIREAAKRVLLVAHEYRQTISPGLPETESERALRTAIAKAEGR